jgi:hypothetical protein
MSELTDSEALALFSNCCKKQSPQSFSDWCSIKDAISIFSSAIACEVCQDMMAHNVKGK